MDITFTDALARLGPNAAQRIINELRPTQQYVFSRLLPDTPIPDYTVKDSTITVRAVMAGLVGMDSPYPESGVMSVSTFMEQSAKVALALDLPEASLRHLQQLVMQSQLRGGSSTEAITQQVLNFARLLAQAQLDTAEWMRGQVFGRGAIDWTFNGIRLQVDYGLPAAHKFAVRTGNDAYGGSASKFWADIQASDLALGGRVDYRFVSRATYLKIISNPVNQLIVTNQDAFTATVRRINAQQQFTSDVRDIVSFMIIDQSGDVIRQATIAGQAPELVQVPFFPDNVMTSVGVPQLNTWTVASGSVPLDTPGLLGYMHLAPTVEGGGLAGRWARVYTPEHRPWALRGETACNELPVVFDPKRIVIAGTE